MASAASTAFWDDLAADMKDPELRRHYILESERIAAIDRVINMLDALRQQEGMSKAELARAIERTPETVRRLLTAKSVNPQFSVIAELAAALGYRVTLEPMSKEERKQIAEPLRNLPVPAA
jgi:ribosome-binding protein aMBF1 (putative translation factor)